ncbi:uncharacterized protein LOC116023537 [Ipomoea triloba]|uniref:uncharacterized protein LOC116023537 n=1 Tax=Ipomoea triloba TaxID=35885 RepID=UPI00125D6A92|nr:uncharacterized protein LOC116023537 [Ipomoea triloba]
MDGFNSAINSSGLSDLEIHGHKFTWDRGRGTPHWSRSVSQSWLELFDRAVAELVITPVSDHLPVIMQPIPTIKSKRKPKFKFENLWLKESDCRTLVAESWHSSRGANLIIRLNSCSKAL